MLFTSALWDWGLTFGAFFFAPFVEFLDFMLSAMMDKAPLGKRQTQLNFFVYFWN